MAGKLAGRVAIVTGAGSGIGKATAARLAAEGAFAVVNNLVEERSEKTAALIREHGGQAESHPGDVTSSSFVDALVEAAVAGTVASTSFTPTRDSAPPGTSLPSCPTVPGTPTSSSI